MKDARLFLETTEDIFTSLDSFIDSFLNEYSFQERELVYLSSSVKNLSDETVESFREFIQVIKNECQSGLKTRDEKVSDFLGQTKLIIANNQNKLREIAGLLDNRSDHFFGDDMEELKEWIGCYLKVRKTDH